MKQKAALIAKEEKTLLRDEAKLVKQKDALIAKEEKVRLQIKTSTPVKIKIPLKIVKENNVVKNVNVKNVVKNVNVKKEVKSVNVKNEMKNVNVKNEMNNVVKNVKVKNVKVSVIKENVSVVNRLPPSDSCVQNKEHKTYIYHILDSKEKPLNAKGLDEIFQYRHLYNDSHFEEKMNDILASCKTRNILVYFSSVNNKSIVKKLNMYFSKYSSGIKHFMNVSFINFVSESKKYFVDTLLFIPPSPTFRKIINVYHGDFIHNIKTYFEQPAWAVGLEQKSDVSYTVQQIVTTPNTGNDLVDQWWFKYYIDIPVCASGRLMQFTGTCWFNAAINAMLLSEITQSLLIAKWELLSPKEKKDIIKLGDLKKCLVKTTPLKQMLLMVIYNILIKNVKLSLKDGNWIKELAGATKSIALENTELKYKDLKIRDLNDKSHNSNTYGDYGDSFWGFDIILGNIFRSHEYKIINLRQYINNSALVQQYNQLIKQTPISEKMDREIKMLYTELQNIKTIQTDREKAFDDYKNMKQPVSWNIGYLNKLSLEREWKDINGMENEALILITFNIKECIKLRKHITIKENKYILEAASITLDNKTGSHAIAGLKCKGRWYVYDSNNKITYCNWQDGDFCGYEKVFISMNYNSALYIKEK